MWLPVDNLIFVSTKKLILNSNWWTVWATYLFHQKRIYLTLYQEEIHYCEVHKYSIETVLPDSSTKLIIAIFRQCVHSINVEIDCRKQKTYCLRLYFLDFAIANFFMILVVFISHRRPCTIPLRIRIFCLFCLMVFLCSFYHLKFREWPFSSAVGHHEC